VDVVREVYHPVEFYHIAQYRFDSVGQFEIHPVVVGHIHRTVYIDIVDCVGFDYHPIGV
jgi:UDP-2,3-diacylglucosamine pyrophosphatase LpxH